MEISDDVQRHLQRRAKDIESRLTTLLAMARSMVRMAQSDAQRQEAQAWVDRLERLGSSLGDGPHDPPEDQPD
jgi:hypothetical protein